MRALGEILCDWRPVESLPSDPLARIGRAWPEIVGEKIAANSHPQGLDRDMLIVTVRSNAWSQQLSFLSERIIEALRECDVQPPIARLRFRVGKITQTSPLARGSKTRRARASVPAQTHAPSVDAHDALHRFRAEVEADQRAKAAAGWNTCAKCGAFIAPSSGTVCPTCADTTKGEREGLVERLFYQTPWLGYDGTAELVKGLRREEYDAVRHKLLARWWDILRRVEHTGHLSRDGRERLIASSYVLLKSGIAPEAIAPATVRNLLGSHLHDLIYGS